MASKTRSRPAARQRLNRQAHDAATARADAQQRQANARGVAAGLAISAALWAGLIWGVVRLSR